MPSHVETHVGTDKNFTVQLRDQQDDPVTSFTADDTPYAEVSSGGNLPVLWAPPAAWLDPSQGKFLIQLTAADTANYDAGRYLIRNGLVLQDGRRLAAPDLDLTLLPSPSTLAVEPKADVTYQRLLLDAPWLSTQAGGPQNFAGFLSERGQARAWFVEVLLMWYDNWRLRCRLSEGWYYSSPSTAKMREYLNDGGYVVTDRILRIQAAKAISIACANALTPGGKAGDNQYQQVAQEMANRANSLFAGLEVQVINDADGVDITFGDNKLENNKIGGIRSV